MATVILTTNLTNNSYFRYVKVKVCANCSKVWYYLTRNLITFNK